MSKHGAMQGITFTREQSTENADRGQMMNGLAAGTDSINMPSADPSALNSTAAQKDLEAFGHSLKPKNFKQQFSLLDQMKVVQTMTHIIGY